MKKMFFVLLPLFLIATTASFTAAEEEKPFFKSELIFEATPARPANHASSIASMPNGDLLVTWFGGSGEGKPDVAIWLSRRPAGSKEWTEPAKIIDDPERAEGNSVLFADSKGKVHLFYVVKQSERWDDWGQSLIYERTSDDSGATWSAARALTDKTGWMIRGNASEFPDGRVMLPIYTEEPPQSMAWISGDDFKSWKEYMIPVTKPANTQPDIESLGGGRMIAIMRHNTFPGKIWMSFSEDWGETWREPKKMRFKNPDSGISVVALDGNTLALAFNDSGYVRTPLSVALSEDGGRTWPYTRNLETTSAEFSYPYLISTPDGLIHITYTADGRKTIKHAEFNTAWLKSK